MIQDFEDLAESAKAQCIDFHVCFSSRHYPNIDMKECRNLVLEDQEDHTHDIAAYIRNKLRVSVHSEPGIATEIEQRASGVFLWVSLVIAILNNDSNHGYAHMIRTRLDEIPDELDKLFQNIIQQGTREDAHLMPTLRCIMFAKRPLSCEELYHAVLHASNIDYQRAGPETAKNFLLSSSKGLAETTKGNRSTVRFIHESVREYLLRHGFGTVTQERNQSHQGSGHEYLRRCCLHFVSEGVLKRLSLPGSLAPAKSPEAGILREQASRIFPFLQYAVENVLFHTERACSSFVSSDEDAMPFPLSIWIMLHNMFEKHEIRRYSPSVTRAYVFAERDVPHLLKLELQLEADLSVTTERHRSLLRAAVYEGHADVVATIFEHGGIASLSREEQGKCLEVALDRRVPEVADLLLRKGIEVEIEGQDYAKVLQMACLRGYDQVVEMLLKKGTESSTKGGHYNLTLKAACAKGYEQAAQLLIDHGAEVNAQGGHYGSSLQAACSGGHESLVQMLLSRGANVNSQGGHHGSALQAAYARNHQTVAQLLLAHGANSDDKQFERDRTPDQPTVYREVYELMQCTEPLCHLGPRCWCDTATKKHYRLLTRHLKRLIQYKEAGKRLESHDDIPDALRQELYAKG